MTEYLLELPSGIIDSYKIHFADAGITIKSISTSTRVGSDIDTIVLRYPVDKSEDFDISSSCIFNEIAEKNNLQVYKALRSTMIAKDECIAKDK